MRDEISIFAARVKQVPKKVSGEARQQLLLLLPMVSKSVLIADYRATSAGSGSPDLASR